ncbi:alpha/beta hydrolase, partial [Streptomyces sp. NPDC048551]|uniref:alpha/beta hydrolase n=1 Tax=Streptomyces sp. NPDC048551 TaxID=3155758 RepID=UPI00343F7D15
EHPHEPLREVLHGGPVEQVGGVLQADARAAGSKGLKMREALGARAVLVTVEQGGHGLYLGNGNACGDRTVTTFLTTGERPAHDTTCAN